MASVVVLIAALVHGAAAWGIKPAKVKPNDWTVIHKQSSAAKGSSTQPAIRYGHTCAAYQGHLVASHGYFYDRETHNVNWLADTWSMPMKAPYKWQLMSPGISQEAALSSYQAAQVPPAPCGRFGHADTMLNKTLYMYGGHDGGYSRHGQQNYVPGHDFAELWAMDFDTKHWELLEHSTEYHPGPRYLAAMTGVGDELLLYGGMEKGQGDVWAFNVTSKEWQYLVPEEPKNDTSPGRRVGHTLTPIHFPHGVARGFILIGGREILPDGSTVLATDTWFFDMDSLRWRRLSVDSGLSSAPARNYHAEAHTYIPVDRMVREFNHPNAVMVGIVVGGTTTTPQLTCSTEAWAFVVDCGVTGLSWHKLPDMPVAVYDVRAAADTNAVYVYGGHLCELQTGFPFYYTNQVMRLDLKAHLGQLLESGCQVDRKQLKTDAPHAHGGTDDEL